MGYRLVYEVVDEILVVYVIAIGRRDNNAVYNVMNERILTEQDKTAENDD